MSLSLPSHTLSVCSQPSTKGPHSWFGIAATNYANFRAFCITIISLDRVHKNIHCLYLQQNVSFVGYILFSFRQSPSKIGYLSTTRLLSPWRYQPPRQLTWQSLVSQNMLSILRQFHYCLAFVNIAERVLGRILRVKTPRPCIVHRN